MDGTPEDAAKYQPQYIKSHFTHIHAVVCYIKETDCYTLTMFSDESVPLFGPLLSNTAAFNSHQQFRRLLLTKCINGEKATWVSNSIRTQALELMLIWLQSTIYHSLNMPLKKVYFLFMERGWSFPLFSQHFKHDYI